MKYSKSSDMPTANEALRLADRYFEASTTEAEEQALKAYVTGDGIDDTRFDEVRALMGLAAYGRALQRRQRPSGTTGAVRHRQRTVLRWAAAVAVGFLAAGATVATLSYRSDNQCVAYINGHKVTETDRVMQAMRTSIREVSAPTETPTVEAQLNDIFKTIE